MQNRSLLISFSYLSRYGCRIQMSCVMRKADFCICENKDADQLCGNRTADQRLCFCYIDFYLNPKFQASNLLWLHSPVCVRPGLKPQRRVFSCRGSNELAQDHTQVGDHKICFNMSCVMRKPVFLVSFQVRH